MKSWYEEIAQLIERLSEEGCTIQDFAQIVRELGIRKEPVGNADNKDLILNQRVTQILREIGMPAHLFGYSYVRSAICEVVENPDVMKRRVVKDLYLRVAKKHDIAPQNVERCIRKAIETAWDRGNRDSIYKYFGYTISSFKGLPTNSEFIATIADFINSKVE